jgi:hypothetical protein
MGVSLIETESDVHVPVLSRDHTEHSIETWRAGNMSNLLPTATACAMADEFVCFDCGWHHNSSMSIFRPPRAVAFRRHYRFVVSSLRALGFFYLRAVSSPKV